MLTFIHSCPHASRAWKAWNGDDGAQCGSAKEKGALAYKTDPGGLSGKKHISFKVEMDGGKTPDFAVTLQSSDKV